MLPPVTSNAFWPMLLFSLFPVSFPNTGAVFPVSEPEVPLRHFPCLIKPRLNISIFNWI